MPKVAQEAATSSSILMTYDELREVQRVNASAAMKILVKEIYNASDQVSDIASKGHPKRVKCSSYTGQNANGYS